MRRNQTETGDEADSHPSARLAVLIDADNAQASLIEPLLAEVAKYGEATVRRIYGDFTSNRLAQWKQVLQLHAIKPMQQYAFTTGKNATDSALIIDAMDLLYAGRFDGFCIVSSDSDFTTLAMRLREEGLMVLGFGAKRTPEAFRNACTRFVLTEVLAAGAKSEAEPEEGAEPAEPAAPRPRLPKNFMLAALEESVDDTGWAHLGTFGTYLNKLAPDFDPRVYGFKKLSDLVRSRNDLFVVEERRNAGSGQPIIYLRARRGAGRASNT